MDDFRRRSTSPAWVIVSQLADPQWTARWIGVDGQGVLTWQDPAGLPQRVATGGLAVSGGSRAGPLDVTIRIRCARRGGGGRDLDCRVALLDVGGDFHGISRPGAASPCQGEIETEA